MPEGLSWTRPEGGFFVWVTLPEGVDTYPLLQKAIDAGVVFIPGAAFTPLGRAVQQDPAGVQRRAAGINPGRRAAAGAGPAGSRRGVVA